MAIIAVIAVLGMGVFALLSCAQHIENQRLRSRNTELSGICALYNKTVQDAVTHHKIINGMVDVIRKTIPSIAPRAVTNFEEILVEIIDTHRSNGVSDEVILDHIRETLSAACTEGTVDLLLKDMEIKSQNDPLKKKK